VNGPAGAAATKALTEKELGSHARSLVLTCKPNKQNGAILATVCIESSVDLKLKQVRYLTVIIADRGANLIKLHARMVSA
jgi:hypothetical protein